MNCGGKRSATPLSERSKIFYQSESFSPARKRRRRSRSAGALHNALRLSDAIGSRAGVLDCGGPPPLFPGTPSRAVNCPDQTVEVGWRVVERSVRWAEDVSHDRIHLSRMAKSGFHLWLKKMANRSAARPVMKKAVTQLDANRQPFRALNGSNARLCHGQGRQKPTTPQNSRIMK